jgi:cytochrome P450
MLIRVLIALLKRLLQSDLETKKSYGRICLDHSSATASLSKNVNPRLACKCKLKPCISLHPLTGSSMAGADSTATATRCTLLHIITNPSVYAKLCNEISTGIRENRISSPVIRNAEALELPYLQACIREGLRIWPPGAGLMTKQAPPDGDYFKGMFIPGNTGIAYSAWGVQRNAQIYGEDVYVFRPERWLEASGEALQKMERLQEMVFGSGRYGCLGKPLAVVELNKVFVQVRDMAPSEKVV